MLIQHGDGTTRGWTLTRVENIPEGDAARLHVHEEPGFPIDRESGAARYYQFPRDTAPGPHRFTISQITRASRTGPLPAVDVGRSQRSELVHGHAKAARSNGRKNGKPSTQCIDSGDTLRYHE